MTTNFKFTFSTTAENVEKISKAMFEFIFSGEALGLWPLNMLSREWFKKMKESFF